MMNKGLPAFLSLVKYARICAGHIFGIGPILASHSAAFPLASTANEYISVIESSNQMWSVPD